MTGQEFKEMQERVEQEGFHYAFHHYSNFEEVKDAKFHELRKAYLDASKVLSEYTATEL